MLNEGIMKEMRDSRWYKKPSERKRIAKNSCKRWQKKVKEMEARGEW